MEFSAAIQTAATKRNPAPVVEKSSTLKPSIRVTTVNKMEWAAATTVSQPILTRSARSTLRIVNSDMTWGSSPTSGTWSVVTRISRIREANHAHTTAKQTAPVNRVQPYFAGIRVSIIITNITQIEMPTAHLIRTGTFSHASFGDLLTRRFSFVTDYNQAYPVNNAAVRPRYVGLCFPRNRLGDCSPHHFVPVRRPARAVGD